MATSSVRWVSFSAERMVVERSEAKVMSRSVGSAAFRRGTAARTPSMVVMMLAPGWRKTITSTAGWPSASPRLRRSWTESSTSATSDRRTASPLR